MYQKQPGLYFSFFNIRSLETVKKKYQLNIFIGNIFIENSKKYRLNYFGVGVGVEMIQIQSEHFYSKQ